MVRKAGITAEYLLVLGVESGSGEGIRVDASNKPLDFDAAASKPSLRSSSVFVTHSTPSFLVAVVVCRLLGGKSGCRCFERAGCWKQQFRTPACPQAVRNLGYEPYWTRTNDTLLKRQVLYQAELTALDASS
jgi:hypothetical protein